MIKVNKKKIKPPDSLLTAGKKELNNAIEEFKKKKTVTVNFLAYKQEDVKDMLLVIFKEKCAYCESRFPHVSPGAIDHFRPKNRSRHYKGPGAKYIGYYWLAMKWDNLLLSCTDCNTQRKHHVPGSAEKLTIGKQDQFPLLKEELRCFHHHHDIKNEKRVMLLIDPCEEDPTPYFEFDAEGLIKSPEKLTGFKLLRSQTSMEVYALYRQELVDARKAYYLKEIGSKILDIKEEKELLEMISKRNKVAIKKQNEKINKKIQALIELGKPENEYSAMAKQVVAAELFNKLGINVNDYK